MRSKRIKLSMDDYKKIILGFYQQTKQWVLSVYDIALILNRHLRLNANYYSGFEIMSICDQLTEMNILSKINDEYYCILDSPYFPSFPVEKTIVMFRSGEWNYVSFETMLCQYGLLSNPPIGVTVATTGEPGRYDLDFGTIIFTHIDLDEDPYYYTKYSFWDAERDVRVASPLLAYADYYNYRETGTEEISKEELEEAMVAFPCNIREVEECEDPVPCL